MERRNPVCAEQLSRDMLISLRKLHQIRRKVRSLERALDGERQTVLEVMRGTDDLMVLLDQEGVVISLNGQAAVALGTTAREAKGQPISNLLPSAIRDQVVLAITQSSTSGKSVSMLGSDIPPGSIHLRCLPITDGSGKTFRMVIAAKEGAAPTETIRVSF